MRTDKELDSTLKCITGYQLQSPFAVHHVFSLVSFALPPTPLIQLFAFWLMVDSYATVAVHKLENEMHSIDTIRLLNCCSFCSWQSTSQIKLLPKSTEAHSKALHSTRSTDVYNSCAPARRLAVDVRKSKKNKSIPVWNNFRTARTKEITLFNILKYGEVNVRFSLLHFEKVSTAT